ncbi:MAG: hypothetical protein IJ680_01345 [Paludibacteraceae bacterium]|nr:hypothetical protein [Eubacterium sp.]MBR1630478.1 hypothetical protein [Paludibacteraceae bacterium]
MMNTLSDLNNYLFEQIERMNDDELTEEQLQKEILRSQAVTKVAEVIVRNGELALKTMQHLNEYGYGTGRPAAELAPVPAMLEAKNK